MTDNHQDDDRLMIPEEVAEYMQVPTSWVYQASRRGDLPCVRVGRYVRFRRSEIAQWIHAGGERS